MTRATVMSAQSQLRAEARATSSRAVFLDRDGVLNAVTLRDGRPYPPDTLASLRVLPGVDDACAQLRRAGFLLIMVTNQPDVARGTQARSEVDRMNRYLEDRLRLTAALVCPHDDADACDCRKPRPGMLLQAARTWDIDLVRSIMVGDRWRDVEAGKRAGCRTVFLAAGYDEPSPRDPNVVVSSLSEATKEILCRWQ